MRSLHLCCLAGSIVTLLLGCSDPPVVPRDTSVPLNLPLDLTSTAAPTITCSGASFALDVHGNNHVSGLPADAFQLTLIDRATDSEVPVSNSCFAEVGDDAAVPYYAACVSDLCPGRDYVLRVRLTVDGGSITNAFFFQTPMSCGDGGTPGPGCPVADASVVDAAMDAARDVATDAPRDVSTDAGDSANDAADETADDAAVDAVVDGTVDDAPDAATDAAVDAGSSGMNP